MTSAGWGDGGVKNVSKNADIYNIASAFWGGWGVNNGQKMADVILEQSLKAQDPRYSCFLVFNYLC